MLTLGIDLASQPKRTAMASITWGGSRATVHEPVSPVSDDDALGAMSASEWTGIDAPFGWPEASTHAVSEFADHGSWPADADLRDLRFRLTDKHVH